jgi:zinc transport system ATP-binding protein
MVSHDISSAVKYASHILHIAKKQLFFGSKSDYVNSKIGKSFIETEAEENG